MTGKKVKILIITILIITSSFSIVGILPSLSGARDDTGGDIGLGEEDSNARGSSRTIYYDMNLSRPGRHQDMTIYGRRGKFPVDQILPIKNITIGDVSGDGYDDLIIGAAGDNISSNEDCGVIYVVFGAAMLPTIYDLANTTTGLTIEGYDINDFEGMAIAVGDINGDGIGDIISGAPGADGPSNVKPNAGEVHVFLGGSYLTSLGNWNLSETSANMTIIGNNTGDALGSSLAIGDLNKDIYDDLIIGAPCGDGSTGVLLDTGEVAVIHGASSLPAMEDLSASTLQTRQQHPDQGWRSR